MPPSARAIFLITIALAGCHDGEGDVIAEPLECAAPNRVVGDRCVEPGVQDNGCPAGTLGLEDGSCRAPGVLAENCAPGFAHDGSLCEPILPSDACPPGQMAVPGEASCRAIMPCGAAPWGAIPVESDTEYVDIAYAGGDSDGSAGKPWTTIGEAHADAAPGALVAIAAGSYVEDVLSGGKPVRLWGVCPERVDVFGIQIGTNAGGSEVHGIAIVGSVKMSGSQEVLLDRVWIHDTPGRGLDVNPAAGATSFVVSGSLIERAHEMGVYVSGSDVTIEGTVVRETLPRADQTFGRGLNIQLSCSSAGCDPNARASATVRGSLIEENHDVGMYISGSDAVVEGSVVRRTQPRPPDLGGGRGMSIRASCGGAGCARSNVLVSSSLIDENHDDGILVAGSDFTMEHTTVRDTSPPAGNPFVGRGISIQPCRAGTECTSTQRSSAIVTGSLIQQTFDSGIFAGASDLTVEATVVRATNALSGDPSAGSGVMVRDCRAADGCTPTERGNVMLRGSLIEDSVDVGVFIMGSDGIVEGTHVRRTVRRDIDHTARGMHIQLSCGQVVPELECDTTSRANVTVKASRVEESHDLGLSVAGADAIFDGVLVEGTRSLPDGSIGDGVTVFSQLAPASIHATNTLISQSGRAGLANFGSTVSLGRVAITCAVLDINGELLGDYPYAFEDRGSNLCGCPTSDTACSS